MLRRFSCFLVVACAAIAQNAEPVQISHEIGSRSVLVDFEVDEALKPTRLEIIASETTGLNPWAESLIRTGMIKPSSPGVTKLGDRKYRATVSFPVRDDGQPLPANTTLPTGGNQMPIQYPFEMARDNISGGALLRLSIDKTAKVNHVELVRASHPAFGKASLETVRKWRFKKAAQTDGAPIDIVLYQLIVFNIVGKAPAPWEWQITPEPALPVFTMTGSYVR